MLLFSSDNMGGVGDQPSDVSLGGMMTCPVSPGERSTLRSCLLSSSFLTLPFSSRGAEVQQPRELRPRGTPTQLKPPLPLFSDSWGPSQSSNWNKELCKQSAESSQRGNPLQTTVPQLKTNALYSSSTSRTSWKAESAHPASN